MIIRNAAQCAQCKDIIESTHVHDLRNVPVVISLLMVARNIYDMAGKNLVSLSIFRR